MYRDFSNYEIHFERFVDNIRYFYENRKQCIVFIKICGDILSEKDRYRFHEVFSPIADGIAVEHLGNVWPNFDMNGLNANQSLDVYGQKIKTRKVCPEIFYKTFINTNGTVSPCTVDWSRSIILGDLKKESLQQIWNGKKLNAFRRAMLKGQRANHATCAACGHLSQGAIDNIDDYAEKLLEKFPEASAENAMAQSV